tara:strand:- start:235012 stop:235203 length:192 start_codon:yes stop_codon:yes gene_type:complete
MRLERHGDRVAAKAIRRLPSASQQLLVSNVHAVEIANGDGGLYERPKKRSMTLEDFHSAATLA